MQRNSIETLTGRTMKRSVFLILIFVLWAARVSQAATNTYSPTITRTRTTTFSYSPTWTATATRTITFTPTSTYTATKTWTITWTPTATQTLTTYSTFTHTKTRTPSATYTATPTSSPTFTHTPTATPTRTVSATPTGTTTPEMINGDFETPGLIGWSYAYTCAPTNFVSNPLPEDFQIPHSGGSSVMLGSSGTAEVEGDSFLMQWVTVPAGPCPRLNFWYLAGSQENDLTAHYDYQQCQLWDFAACHTVLATVLDTTTNSLEWNYVSYDLSAFVGQSFLVVFKVHQDGYGDTTSMYVDDVSITTACFTATHTPTITLTPTASFSPTITLTLTMTKTPTASYTPCVICTAAAGSWTPTMTRTISATATATPSATRTATPGGITGGLLTDFEDGTGRSVYGGEGNTDVFNCPLTIQMISGCPYGTSAVGMRCNGSLAQGTGGNTYFHMTINILPGGTAVDIRDHCAGHAVNFSFNNATPGAVYEFCMVSANVTDADYYCVTFTAGTAGWQDYTIYFPDVNTTGLQFSQSGSGVAQSWGSCAGQMQSIRISPLPSTSGPVNFDFKIDDIRLSDGAPATNNLGTVCLNLGCSLPTAKEAYDLNLDEYLTWIVIRISMKCGCSPHDILSLRSTLSWGEICETYGLTWSGVIADVDSRMGGLTPVDADPGQCLQTISNGSEVMEAPDNPPYVPAGSLTPFAPSLVCP